MKILVVCLGNICRSPMAEGIIRDRFAEAGIDAEIDSAGTANYHVDAAPDSRGVANMKSNGHDISQLRGRQFTVEDYDVFDRIFVMDKSNMRNVLNLARNKADEDKVSLFLNLAFPGLNREVPDPYYGGDGGFQQVYELLEAATHNLIKEING